MLSNIFCLILFIYLINQTIAAPQLKQESEETFHFNFNNQEYFGEEFCLNRNLSVSTSVRVLKNLLIEANRYSDFQTSSTLEEEEAKIQRNFDQIISLVNSIDETKLEQDLPKAVNNTGNKIAFILLSGTSENLKAKVNKVDGMNKQLSEVLQSRNPALGKKLMEELNNKIVMSAMLKKKSEVFQNITETMDKIMHEVNSYEPQLWNNVLGTMSTLKNQLKARVQKENIIEWSKSTENIMQPLYKQLRAILNSSNKSKLGQCLVEDAMIKVFNNGHKLLFA